MEIQELKKKTVHTDENKASVKLFNSFQEEYRAIVDELVKEVKDREKVIEKLSTKIDVNDKKHREYRFSFGNVSLVEERLQKMEGVYNSKLSNCFDHYSKTIEILERESNKVSFMANRLKEEHPKASRIISSLYEIVKVMSNEVSCFEKFLNKFRNIKEISQVVDEYLSNKHEIKKSINRVIYLEEMAKYKNKNLLEDRSSQMKKSAYETLDNLDTNFKAVSKDQRVPIKPRKSSVERGNVLLNESNYKMFESHNEFKKPKKIVGFVDSSSNINSNTSIKPATATNFKINRNSSAAHLKPSQLQL